MNFVEEKKRQVEEWMRRQPPQVEVAAATASGAAQGALIGGLMATFSSMEPPPGAAGMPPPPKPPGLVGGPVVLARNFAVMTGVNAGLQSAIKKARGGVEDVQGSMAASFGAGAAFSIVSSLGAPAGAVVSTAPAAVLMDAIRTGAVFSLLQGAFYQIGNMMSGGKKTGQEDLAFIHTKAMLTSLGLSQYEKHFRKGQLDDLTLPLLTDSALKEVRIPPGPRLRILQHVAYVRGAAAAHQQQRGHHTAPNQPVAPLSLALPPVS